MALNLNRRRPRSQEEEGFSLREISASVSGPVMFFLVIVAVIFVMSVFFRVSDIQVRGNTHYTDEEIIRAIDIEEGDNLFFFDRFAALSRVFAKLPAFPTASSSPSPRARPWPISSSARRSGPSTITARCWARPMRTSLWVSSPFSASRRAPS